MTKRDIDDIVSTDKNKADENKSRKERIMTTVNFVYYLNSEHYETLHSKEKKQGLILVRSCTKYRDRNKITTGFEIAAGTVENGTKDCESGAEGSRKTAAV